MVQYKCPRCNYETFDKSRYYNHLKRKKICENINNVDNLNKEYIKYQISDKYNLNPNESILNPNESILNPNKSKIKEYKCKYCENKYSTNSNLSKHVKICKEKKKR